MADVLSYAEIEARQADFGQVTWHSSEEDGGPDVGLTVGLGNGVYLWAGEMSNQLHAEEDCGRLSSSDGWWLILYGPGPRDSRIIGKCLDEDAARSLTDAMQASARRILTIAQQDKAEALRLAAAAPAREGGR